MIDLGAPPRICVLSRNRVPDCQIGRDCQIACFPRLVLRQLLVALLACGLDVYIARLGGRQIGSAVSWNARLA